MIAFGPEQGPLYPPGTAEYLLSLYYIESGRIETLAMGEPFSTKVVSNNRVYLARDLLFKVVDLVQRRVIYQTLLLFAPTDMDAYQEAGAFVAIDHTSWALWVLRLSAQ